MEFGATKTDTALEAVPINGPGGRRTIWIRQGTSDGQVLTDVFAKGGFDLGRLRRADEIFDFVNRRCAAGESPLIVDAGAYIGVSSVFFAMTYSTASIVAVEPAADNFDLLRRNVEGLKVRCVNAALSSAPGRSKVVDPGENKWGFRTVAAEDGVPHVTVGDIYAEAGPRTFPFIVKIDVEGAERDVFAANVDWVAKTPIIILEPHDWMLPKAGVVQPFLRCIAALDRDFLIHNEQIISIAHDFG